MKPHLPSPGLGRGTPFEGFTERSNILAFMSEHNFDEKMKISQEEEAT